MADKVREVTDEFGRKAEFREGLEGVVAALSTISSIDGEKGILLYRGIPIEQLAEHSTFEETACFLLHGHLPKRQELTDFENKLKSRREVPPAALDLIKKFPPSANAMDLLRTTVSALGLYDSDPKNNSVEKNVERAIDLIAAFPTIVAAIQRRRSGKEFIPPRQDLGHAANFLYMVNGEAPTDYVAKVMDVALILHADHGFNASTFTSRVVISSMSDMYSAITAAVGSLKGPLHGGANSEVMSTLQSIGSIDKVEAYVMDRLAKKEKVMGFGHRVYHTYDPRARILSQYSQQLAQQTGNMKWYEISKKIEEIMGRELGEKGIYPNVDFYSATVYYYMGLDQELFTPIFAVSRIAGWTAHVIEQLQNNRLFRPRSVYTGEKNLPYTPIDKR
ncbi:MAG: citrate synthase [candidate division KSB1 bacterium]|nr:citrate synthase [candidate division KSB1 bacterium]MDZ7366841.1 citrate synthase [candidate division KSB1 bacterium]MDZ7405152.1 citrate synthase [candidate division KSB1 bacterium]